MGTLIVSPSILDFPTLRGTVVTEDQKFHRAAEMVDRTEKPHIYWHNGEPHVVTIGYNFSSPHFYTDTEDRNSHLAAQWLMENQRVCH